MPEETYVNEPLTLKAQAEGGKAPYTYKFTAKINGSWTTLYSGSESEYTYTFAETGSYPVSVTVTDSAKKTDKAQDTIVITERPSEEPLSAELIVDESAYAGEPTVLRAEASGGTGPYKYKFTAKINGSWTTLYSGSESEFTYTFMEAGSYPVNVTVTDSAKHSFKAPNTLKVIQR